MVEFEYELVLMMHGITYARYRWSEAPPTFTAKANNSHGWFIFRRTTKKYELDGVIYWFYEWVQR